MYQRVQNSSSSLEFVIKLTYAELYNEEIRDLLAPLASSSSQDTQPLKIIDDPALGPLIQVTHNYINSIQPYS